MRTLAPILAISILVAGAAPALAFRGGSSGGDREPAGGAFMSSYTYPGSTGVQQGGPPRSVDIPQNTQRYGYEAYEAQPRSYRQRGW